MFQPTRQSGAWWTLGLMAVLASVGQAAPKSWLTTGVGAYTVAGTATVSRNGRITLSGEGTDIGATADGFQFVYQSLQGDGQITARLAALDTASALAKAGVMIRETLTPGSINASLVSTPSSGLLFQQRAVTGGATSSVPVAVSLPRWLRLARRGRSVTASVSTDGTAWTDIGTRDVPMAAKVYLGLAVTSRSPGQLATASFERAATTALATTTPPPAAPVAAWSFDDGAGPLLRASIGGLDGTITGATWTSTGRYGGALVFDGVGNVVTVPASPALNLTTGMTLEAWVNPVTLSNWRNVVLKEGSSGLAYGLYASDASSRPQSVINVGAGDVPVTGTAALPLSTWTHVATTFDGSMQRLFVNGVQVASLQAGGSLVQTSGALRIGGNAVWGEFFDGALDDLRIYNRALTATEIQADMNTPVPPPPADTTSPTVAISAPVSGSTVSRSVTVVATASDNVGVASVQFLLDGRNLGAAVTASPYSVVWNTASDANGAHRVSAVARDFAGNTTASSDVPVTVNNDTTPPSVAISTPAAGATVSGSVTVAANASDNVAVTSVQFLLNGVNLGAPTTTVPYTVVWNTASSPNGTYRLAAAARDAAGNTTVSPDVIVTVNNASPLIVGRLVQFTSADHFATLPDGRATVTGYTVEVWTKGSNTSTGQPFAKSNLGKPASTTSTITVDQQTFFNTLPKGQAFFATVTAAGPGGTARSGASNEFMMQ